MLGDDESDGDADRRGERNHDDVEDHVPLLCRAGAHLHADAEEDGRRVDGDRGEQLPHVARSKLQAYNLNRKMDRILPIVKLPMWIG